MPNKPYGTALCYDSGLYPAVATKLAESFESVGYYTPYNAEAFPVSRRALWGVGLPGVTRVNDFWDAVDDADVIIFPDLGSADLQVWLRSKGYRCFGAAASEILELDRVGLKRLMLAKGMNRPPTWIIQGIEALGEHLQDPKNDNQFVKTSEFRGDAETHRHLSWFTTEPWFNRLKHQLGPMGEQLEFVVEGKVEGVEIGVDTICIDGRFPALVAIGYEAKDIGLVGRVVPYDELPRPLAEVNADLTDVLRDMQCRSLFSTEVRVDKDGQGYLVDATLRTPSPPGGALLELYPNIADVMYHGAAGEWIEPVPKAAYIAELILRSEWAKNDFLAVRFPEEFRHLIKLHGHAIIDGTDYVVSLGIDTIGEAVGLGETMDEAMEQAIEVAQSVEGESVDCEPGAFDELRDTIAKGRACGISWD